MHNLFRGRFFERPYLTSFINLSLRCCDPFLTYHGPTANCSGTRSLMRQFKASPWSVSNRPAQLRGPTWTLCCCWSDTWTDGPSSSGGARPWRTLGWRGSCTSASTWIVLPPSLPLLCGGFWSWALVVDIVHPPALARLSGVSMKMLFSFARVACFTRVTRRCLFTAVLGFTPLKASWFQAFGI